MVLFPFLLGIKWNYKTISITEARPRSESSSKTMTWMQCDKGRKCIILEKFWREVAFVQKVGLLVASTSAGQRGPGMAGGPWELRPHNHPFRGPMGQAGNWLKRCLMWPG